MASGSLELVHLVAPVQNCRLSWLSRCSVDFCIWNPIWRDDGSIMRIAQKWKFCHYWLPRSYFKPVCYCWTQFFLTNVGNKMPLTMEINGNNNAGLLQPNAGSNMDKHNCWVNKCNLNWIGKIGLQQLSIFCLECIDFQHFSTNPLLRVTNQTRNS